jgi:NitT/TauT family transport system permease protein
MQESLPRRDYVLLPLAVAVLAIALWGALSRSGVLPTTAFPSPGEVAVCFVEEARSGSLFRDIVASLFRVAAGFALSVFVGVPLGLAMGLLPRVRAALLPSVNFLRNLSPIAWIPFAIFWFGIGDAPAIFLIFMAGAFSLALTTLAAVANVPAIHFRVARDFGLRGSELLTQVTLPAILPQIITSLRVTTGISWLVVVAAEMIAGRDGLGFMVWDARNGLRMDRLVVAMIMIGIIGILLDRLMVRLTQIPSVRWGYER